MTEKKLRLILTAIVAVTVALCVGTVILAWAFPHGFISELIMLSHLTVQKPRIFGWFHISSLLLCVAFTAVIFIFHKRISIKILDLIVLSSGILLLLAETYKQLYYHLIIGNGHYNFGILPLQFCSYSMYLFLFIPLLPQSKLKRSLYSFCALYQVMGGGIVMSYPTLYSEISLSIHTMLWHTVMIVTGVLILKKLEFGKSFFSELLPATAIFLGTATIAISLNFILTPYTDSSPAPLNLFYMSPYETNNYILISQIRESLGWLPSMLCYLILFICLGAPLIWLLARITGNKKTPQ